MEENERQELKEEYEKQVARELQELAAYKTAIEQEFSTKTLDDPVMAARAKEEIVGLVPEAAVQLRWLITHADSESIRKDISKWVMELAMQTSAKNERDDALNELLESITKAPVEAPTVKD